MRKVLTLSVVSLSVLGLGSVSPASAATNPGCNLSANWRVTASARWSGTTFRYGVLNSPGPLRVLGRPDGTVSEFFLWRDDEIVNTGVYSDRDPAKAPRYVYPTNTDGGPDNITNIESITQVAIAPSGAFCLIKIDRP